MPDYPYTWDQNAGYTNWANDLVPVPVNLTRYPFARMRTPEQQVHWLYEKLAQAQMHYITFADPIEWDTDTNYQQYTICVNGDYAYLAKKFVPAGTALTNAEYWINIGDLGGLVVQERTRAQAAEAALQADVNTKLPLSGGTMTGELNVQPPQNDMNPTTLIYVRSKLNEKLNITGGTMTGELKVQAPVNPQNPITKDYAYNNYFPLSGGTITGFLRLRQRLVFLNEQAGKTFQFFSQYSTSSDATIGYIILSDKYGFYLREAGGIASFKFGNIADNVIYLTLDDQGLDCQNKKIKRIATPTTNTDAANKKYVDDCDLPIKDHLNFAGGRSYAWRSVATPAGTDAFPAGCNGGFNIRVSKDKRNFTVSGHIRNTAGDIPAGRLITDSNTIYGYKIAANGTIDTNAEFATYNCGLKINSTGNDTSESSWTSANYINMVGLIVDKNGAIWAESLGHSSSIKDALYTFTSAAVDLGLKTT